MKRQNYGVLIGFFLFMVCCSLLTVGAAGSEQTMSEAENRMLQEKPQLSLATYQSGDFFQQYEAYLSDHIPSRAVFLQKAEWLKERIACQGESPVQVVETTADVGVQQAGEEEKSKQELLVLNDRLLELYHQQQTGCDAYVAAVNRCAQWLPENINFYHMLIPMPIAFAPQQYQQLSDNQQQTIAAVYSQLNARVCAVDVYSVLAQHQQEDIYFRTDHHWTALGAYYGAEAFAQAADLTLPPLAEYEAHIMSGYLGQLALNNLTPQLERHREDVIYYLRPGRNNSSIMYFYEDGITKSFTAPMINDQFNQGKADYGIFISGDYPYTVVEGDADNNRVLAVVKDSYGNALIPWLAAGYEQILAIDPRTCQEDIGQLLQQYQVTDFLLLNYVKVTSTSAYAEQLQALLDKSEA